MSTASLWAGIESIFGIDKELRFRLAALTASFLEPRGDQRITRYKAVKKLYDFRSRVVHGAAARDTELVEHIREVRLLLSSLLCRMIESRHAPFGDEWDSVLLG
jgi:hypothetical protein